MSIQLDPELRLLFGLVTGMEFPEADEDMLRQLAAAWSAAGDNFQAIVEAVSSAAKSALETMGGAASTGFIDLMDKLVDKDPKYLPTIIKQARDTSAYISKAALQVEYTKWSVLAMLIIIAMQIALMILFPGGFTLIPGLQALGRSVAGRLVAQLIESLIISEFLMLGSDAIIQSIQKAQGNRADWDTNITKNAASGAALGAAIGTGLKGIAEGLAGELSNTILASMG